MVKVFTPWERANARIKTLIKKWLSNIYKHIIVYYYKDYFSFFFTEKKK